MRRIGPCANPPSTSVTATTISGSAVKGPVAGATVTVKKAADGSVLATTTTKADGSYTVDVAVAGDVIVEVNGGSYTDEATGAKTDLTSPMKAVLTAAGGKVTGVVTPLTTLAFNNAFPTTTTSVTAAAYKAKADALATQLKLSGVDLTTQLPVVSGTTNAYGDALRTLSQVMATEKLDLNAVLKEASTSPATFGTKFSSAYTSVTGQKVTYTFDNGTITTTVTNPNGGTTTVNTGATGTTVEGTGAGGGSGTCGVSMRGSYTVAGMTVPLSFDYCVSGLTASCDANNPELVKQISAASSSSPSMPAGISVNYTYEYSSTCKAGAYPFTIKS